MRGGGLAADLRNEIERHALHEAGKRERQSGCADDRDRKRHRDEQNAHQKLLHRPTCVAPHQAFGCEVRAHGYSVAIQTAHASPDRGLSHADKGGLSETPREGCSGQEARVPRLERHGPGGPTGLQNR
jgi:hypothetical protein